MIRDSKTKSVMAYRTLREAPFPSPSNVDIVLFANYYGSIKKSHRFDDPVLYTDKPWWTRLKEELLQMTAFRRKIKSAKIN